MSVHCQISSFVRPKSNMRSRHRMFMQCKAGTWTKVARTQVAKVRLKKVKQDTEKFVVVVWHLFPVWRTFLTNVKVPALIPSSFVSMNHRYGKPLQCTKKAALSSRVHLRIVDVEACYLRCKSIHDKAFTLKVQLLDTLLSTGFKFHISSCHLHSTGVRRGEGSHSRHLTVKVVVLTGCAWLHRAGCSKTK